MFNARASLWPEFSRSLSGMELWSRFATASPNPLEGDNLVDDAADIQQQRLLEGLREAGEQAVAFAELGAGGIDFPAAVVSELELSGYAIERVYDHGGLVGVRLFQPEPAEAPAAHRRGRRPWPHR